MISGKKVLMVGGSGFIGSTLLSRIIDDNEIVVYDTFERDALSGLGFEDHPNLTKVKGDVLDLAALTEAMAGCDTVVHLAAVAGVETVVKKPTKTMRVNMIGTANVLEAAAEHGCERVITFSTSEVFGPQAFRSAETDRTVMGALGEARWTYAVSKLAGEHLAHGYYKEHGLGTVVIRPFNVYGPGQIGEGAIHTFVKNALAGDDLVIRGDGTQIRAWCYIDDIVRALLECLERDEALGESFNIGNTRAVITVYGLANAVVRITGSDSKIVYLDVNEADVELRVPNVDKAKEVLGFEAEVDLDEGIQRTADWYREHGPAAKEPAPVTS